MVGFFSIALGFRRIAENLQFKRKKNNTHLDSLNVFMLEHNYVYLEIIFWQRLFDKHYLSSHSNWNRQKAPVDQNVEFNLKLCKGIKYKKTKISDIFIISVTFGAIEAQIQ